MPTEAEDAGCEPIAADLVELHEVLEWEAAVQALEAAESARGVTESARAPEDSPTDRDPMDPDPPDDDDGPDVSDTQTGQGIP